MNYKKYSHNSVQNYKKLLFLSNFMGKYIRKIVVIVAGMFPSRLHK